MTTPALALDEQGLDQFERLRPEAIWAVARRFAASLPATDPTAAQKEIEAFREDLEFQLEFLRPVFQFGLIEPLLAYLHWLAGVLVSRDVPADRLPRSLEWLAEFFAANLAPPAVERVVAALSIAKARLESGLETMPANDAMAPNPWAECAEFEAALLRGDRICATALFERCLGNGRGLLEAELHMIQPTLYSIGRRWQNNEVTVAQEHMATAIVQSLMTQGFLKSELPPANGRRVLLACVQGNHHSVGLQMVADAFQMAGWEVQFLGANVPTAALLEHVGHSRPELLGLSISFPQQFRTIKDILAALRAAYGNGRPAVIIGGLAVNQFTPMADTLGADGWSADAGAAVPSAVALAARSAAA
jgi:methanogenic corrinoid protein MtbC1